MSPAAGWSPKRRDDFPDFIGPMWEKMESGARIFGLLTDRRHANDRGVVHGGVLMTFADHSIGELVLDSCNRAACATIQLNTHFLGAVRPGDFVEARGRIVRATRRLRFVHGLLSVEGKDVGAIDGVWTLLQP